MDDEEQSRGGKRRKLNDSKDKPCATKVDLWSLPWMPILGHLRPHERWNFALVCQGALKEVETYSDHVLAVIKGPDNCHVDETFEDRLSSDWTEQEEAEYFHDQPIELSLAMKVAGRNLPSRFFLQRASKVPLYSIRVKEEPWKLCLSPSHERLLVFEYDTTSFHILNLTTRKEETVLTETQICDWFKEERQDWEYHWNLYEDCPSIFFLDEEHVAVKIQGVLTFIWNFTNKDTKNNLRYLGHVDGDFIHRAGDEYLYTEEGKLYSLNLRDFRSTTIMSLDMEDYRYPKTIGIAHGKFLVVKANHFVHNGPQPHQWKKMTYVRVYNLETKEITVREDHSECLRMVQLEDQQDLFCVHSQDLKLLGVDREIGHSQDLKLLAVDHETGKLVHRTSLEVDSPKIDGNTPTVRFTSERLLVLAVQDYEGWGGVEVYDLYARNENDDGAFDAVPKHSLRKYFISCFTASAKRNTSFLGTYIWDDHYAVQAYLLSEPAL